VVTGSGGPAWLTDPREAVDRVAARSTVVSGSGAAEPTLLTDALAERAAETRIELHTGLLLGGYRRFPATTRIVTWFPTGSLVDGDAQVEVIPLSWYQVDRHLRRLRPDVALLQVSPPDADGYCGCGLSSSHVRAMVESASTVIAQVNEALPVTPGLTVHVSDLDVAVKVDQPPPAFPARPIGPVASGIGRRIAETVPDGSTIQLGIGSVPHAVALALATLGRRNLTVLGQVGDWVLRLDEAGCLAGDEPLLLAEIGGSPRLYEWVHRNDRVRMADVRETHGPRRRTSRPVVSVNSVLEVDVRGQANAETVDGAACAPLGGLLDFAMARRAEHGDRFVLGLPATTPSGRSRIVAALNGPVSLPRGLVSEVFTEHGAADLDDLSDIARGRAVASLAGPAYREQLYASLDGR
jgi:acyl-CoA hydrolase